MAEGTTIKISNVVKDKLLDLKIDNEGYSVIIANVLKENERLKEEVEYLKEDKKNLYKLALGSSDSVALVSNIHRISYFIASVVNDVSLTNEEKLQQLEIYLTEMLETNPEDVKATVENLKEMFKLDKETVPEVLIDFENYLQENY